MSYIKCNSRKLALILPQKKAFNLVQYKSLSFDTELKALTMLIRKIEPRTEPDKRETKALAGSAFTKNILVSFTKIF